MSCAKTAELIDLPFGLWTQVGWGKHKLNCIRQVAPMCPHERAYWRQLANMIELSVCSMDAALSNYVNHLFVVAFIQQYSIILKQNW